MIESGGTAPYAPTGAVTGVIHAYRDRPIPTPINTDVIERIGEDKILFASDYPHWDGIFPHVVSTIRGRKDISERAKEKILGENALRFYGWGR